MWIGEGLATCVRVVAEELRIAEGICTWRAGGAGARWGHWSVGSVDVRGVPPLRCVIGCVLRRTWGGGVVAPLRVESLAAWRRALLNSRMRE